MKKYNNPKKKKTHIFTWIVFEAIFIFIIATASITLYDMYINIDVEPNSDYYTAEKIAKEVSTEDTDDISEVLENTSKSVVRNIKNSYK